MIAALHVVTASQRRGAEIFAVDLAAALTHGANGVVEPVPGRVAALTAGPQGNALDVDILGTKAYSPTTIWALRRASGRADAVVAYGSKTLLASVAGLVGRSTPLVYRNIGDPLVWSGQGWRRQRVAALLRRTTRIVAVWPGAAATLTEVHGIPSEQITVIPRGVPEERSPVPDAHARRQARRSLGLPSDAPVVASLGALSPEKDVGTAISAVARIEHVHLLVAGDGPDRASLEAQAGASGAAGRIHFAGVLSGPQQALAAADALVLTSHTEGMPGVLIEAGLAARPAVASAVGGVGEIVRDGETGRLCLPGDVESFAEGLRQVLAEPGTLGAAARRHCLANFEMKVVAARWASLLAEVTNNLRLQ